MISCKPQGRANHCTTSVDAEMFLCMVLVSLILHCWENYAQNVTLRLVSDTLRGARRATRAGHDVAGMGLPVHLDSPGPDSEVLALRLDSKLELSLWPSVLAARPSAMRVPQTAGTSLLKPDSTPLQNKIKTICEPAGLFLNYF